MQDHQITEAMARADRIKATAPASAVTADAIFVAICTGTRTARARRPPSESDAPEWFAHALKALQGKRLTVGRFMVLAGKTPATKAEKNAVGRWLRASGREPKRQGGEQLFMI